MYACNLGNENTAEKSVHKLFEQTGKLDHIIFTVADFLAIMPIEDISIDKMQKAGLLRFYVPLLTAKYAPRYLNPGPRSSITFTTGSVAQKPLPQWAVIVSYATAIERMTRRLALDVKPIRVNCVAPGVVDTNLWTDEQRNAVFPGLAASLPIGRITRAEDVAEAYLYLVKDENVDGTMISTNGGALLV
jgi:NAD(P)-dependent dehydrogenase (short-subunit alcohol dehydrogenase family)